MARLICAWCSGNGCGSCGGHGDVAEAPATWSCRDCGDGGKLADDAPEVIVCPSCKGLDIEEGISADPDDFDPPEPDYFEDFDR